MSDGEAFVAAFIDDMVAEAAISAASPRRRANWRVNPYNLNEKELKKNFRLSKEIMVNLVNVLEPILPQTDIDVNTKVLCAVNFFATGSYQTSVGNSIMINLSQSSVSNCMTEVVDSLNTPDIFNHWIHFPEFHQDMNQIVRGFYDRFGFPGIIGCIDCTHVATVPPAANMFDERSYVNRKNFHSINTQLICDFALKIINVNALFPGSTHDCHIWNSSNVLTVMETLHNQGHDNYHLIGDSGYPLRPWCLIPLSDPEEGTAEWHYNQTLKKVRSTIERCNGVLKARFRCLIKDRVLHYTPNKATKIINACAVLHNMCVAYNLDEPQIDLNDDQLGLFASEPFMNLMAVRGNLQLMRGRAKQNRIINNYFNC